MTDRVMFAYEGEFEPSGYAENRPAAAAREAWDSIQHAARSAVDPILTVTMPDGDLHEIDLARDENWCLTHGSACE